MSGYPPLFFASDHGGYILKESLIEHYSNTLPSQVIHNLGTYTNDSVDYIAYADKVCLAVGKGDGLGILLCGTGIGMSIRANRFLGIRAALVVSEEMARLAKEHNNANILCLGGRTTSFLDAIYYIDQWLMATFQGGRHQRRVELLDKRV